MSRSFKKTPYCGDAKGKVKKQMANSKVRSYLKKYPELVIANGDFKKIFESYDICDFYSIENFDEYFAWHLKFYNENKNRWPDMEKPNKKQLYRDWYKSYKMK